MCGLEKAFLDFKKKKLTIGINIAF